MKAPFRLQEVFCFKEHLILRLAKQLTVKSSKDGTIFPVLQGKH